jgi:hypothetical protein
MAEEGGPELAERLEAEGYDRYVRAAKEAAALETAALETAGAEQA